MAAEATMTAKGSKRGARVLSVALLAAIGAYLADRVMLFTTPPPAVPGASAAQTLAPAYDRQRLLQTTLFGTAAAPSNAGPVVNAPETRLALTLHGLFSGNSESSALISAAGGQPRRYLEGASLPGGAVLAEVQKDQVLLRRQGQLEVLRLPKGAAAAGFRTQGTGPSAASAVLSALPPTLPGVQDTRRPRNASANPSSSRQRSVSARATPSASASYGSGANAFSPRSRPARLPGRARGAGGGSPCELWPSPPPAAPAAWKLITRCPPQLWPRWACARGIASCRSMARAWTAWRKIPNKLMRC